MKISRPSTSVYEVVAGDIKHKFLRASSNAIYHNGLIAGGKELICSWSQIDPVFQIGLPADTPDSGWDWSPSTHGNQSAVFGQSIFADNLDVSSMPVGAEWDCSEVSIAQAVCMIDPHSGLVCGNYSMSYTVDAAGKLTAAYAVTIADGFEVRAQYQGNMACGADINRCQIGTGSAISIVGDGASKGSAQVQTGKLYSTNHSRYVVLDFHGAANFTDDAQNVGMFLLDNAGNPAKLYTVAVSSPPRSTRKSFSVSFTITPN